MEPHSRVHVLFSPEQRLRLAMINQRDKKCWHEICEDFGISKSWYYELCQRYDSDGVDGLKNSKCPNTSH